MAAGPFDLRPEVLGALPIIDHFLTRLGADALIEDYVGFDGRARLDPARALGVVLRALCLSHQPVYALGEWAAQFDPDLLGLEPDEVEALNDDRVGRSLARLFDADRASLLTALVVGMICAFGIDCSQLHNDSTTITFAGAYRAANGRTRGGKATAVLARGHNKDHRPDLKQLLWVLTVSSDGAVPLAHRVEAGNTADDVTHIPTWDTLVDLVGRADFLYVADAKLCNRAAMDHIDAAHGRFLTVMPRSRAEDGEFRRWIADHEPDWAELRRCPGRRKADPDQCWWGFEWPRPSGEGYRICWIRSSTKLANDAQARDDRIRRASKELEALAARLASPRSRHRDKVAVEAEAAAILEATSTAGLIRISVTSVQEERMRQEGTGRPGPDTRYRKLTRVRLGLSFCVDADALKAVAASDGCFALITNDKTMTPAALLGAYKYQPHLERRHADLKGPMEVAPVFLKDPVRIEGLLCLEFVAQLTRALIEREIRSAMAKADITHLALYPEDRACSAPSATRIFQLFSGLTRNHLLHNGRVVQVFPPKLSPLQRQVLDLLGIPASAYAD